VPIDAAAADSNAAYLAARWSGMRHARQLRPARLAAAVVSHAGAIAPGQYRHR
jgi:hypothetical protein